MSRRPLAANFSCSSTAKAGECYYADNMGWRYAFWTFGGLTLVMSLLRFLFPLQETPKYLLGKRRDAEAVKVIQKIAESNGKSSWLTVQHFEAIDAELALSDVSETADQAIHRRQKDTFKLEKISALFSTKKMAFSTSLMVLLWCMIGMAYPLYNSFIPIYLANKGLTTGASSINITYRNYAIQAVCGIPSSIIGGYAIDVKYVGRKGVGALSCIFTGIFLFLYTRATTQPAVLGFSCAIAFFQNIVYGLLYSYTPELFPAPIRGTGNGLVALFNRLSGLMAPIIAAYIGVDTSLPVWISAALFMVAGVVFLALPYETRGRAAA